MISEDDQLSNGFNAIGFSQGGQFLSVLCPTFVLLFFLFFQAGTGPAVSKCYHV